MFNRKKENISLTVSTEDCIGCGLCVERCRRDAIGLIKLRNETYAMLIHPENCSGCGKCARSCKYNAIEISTECAAFEEPAWEF